MKKLLLFFCLYFPLLSEASWCDISDALCKQAEQGDIKAQHFLGSIYYSDGSSGNYKLAQHWFQEAANQGHADSQYKLGDMFHKGKGVRQDHQKAIYWYQKSAEQDFGPAQHTLGRMYNEGIGIKQNREEAKKWLGKACNNGDYDDLRVCNEYYVLNEFFECNITDNTLCSKAQDGDLEAQATIAEMYYTGKGFTYNKEEALYWAKKAAEQGNAAAQRILGLIYYNDHEEQLAAQWIMKAAEQGDPTAQYDIGLMYYYGPKTYASIDIFTQDYQKSFQWIKKAAEQDYLAAKRDLGVMYFQGVGVKQNYQQALEWLQKAADEGDALAQRILGAIYYEGVDGAIEQNKVKAKELHGLACDNGRQESCDDYRELNEAGY